MAEVFQKLAQQENSQLIYHDKQENRKLIPFLQEKSISKRWQNGNKEKKKNTMLTCFRWTVSDQRLALEKWRESCWRRWQQTNRSTPMRSELEAHQFAQILVPDRLQILWRSGRSFWPEKWLPEGKATEGRSGCLSVVEEDVQWLRGTFPFWHNANG